MRNSREVKIKRKAKTAKKLSLGKNLNVPIEFGNPVPQRVILQVTRQLGAFSAAAVPLIDSLEMLARSTKDKRMSGVLSQIAQSVVNGSTLSEAFAPHHKIFPPYYLAVLSASERSGDLVTTFETLSDYLERDFASTRAIKSALYYPAILVALSGVAVIILSVIVLPRFEEFFASLNTQLPITTRILLNSTRFLTQWWWLLAVGAASILLIFFLYWRTQKGHLRIDRTLLHFPVIGDVIKIVAVERFSRILGSLTRAGVPLVESLTLTSKVMGNRAFEQAVITSRESIIIGGGFIEPLNNSKVFPEETIQILRVGEASGRLAQQLDHAATYYEKEVDFKLKNISSLIEPIVLLVVGGGVGFVAIALVSAMYGIYSSTSLSG